MYKLVVCFLLCLSVFQANAGHGKCNCASPDDVNDAYTACNDASTILKGVARVFDSSVRNLALGKPATQVSQYGAGAPSRAVDGNWNPNWGGNSCTHTLNNAQSWWQVDLGAVYNIANIMVQNRLDCCQTRLSNVRILVGKNAKNMKHCATHKGAVGTMLSVSCDKPQRARFVKIQLMGKNYLTLCEVAVLGN